MPALSGVARPHGRRRPPCGGTLYVTHSTIREPNGLWAYCNTCDFANHLGDVATLDTIAAAAREHIDRQVRSTT